MKIGHLLMLSLALMLSTSTAKCGVMDALKDFQGIKYTQEGRAVGMPMGGVGAGSIEVTSQGTLAEFANMNNWAARIPSIPGSGLWLTVTRNSKTDIYPLAGGKVNFEGNFPFAKLTFPDLPVDVTLWCWSPFVLHDIRRSAYPTAIFDAEIKNTTSEKAEVGFVLSYGTNYSEWFRNIALPKSAQMPVIINSKSSPYSSKLASGISWSTKAAFDQAAFKAKIDKVRKGFEDAYLRSYDYTPIDIRTACNKSYLSKLFGEDPGNAKLGFADMKPGKRDVYGIPFDIVDDAANAGKSIVMVGPSASVTKVNIPINRKADCLFFFGNTCGWANAANSTAEYVVKYKDGTKETVSLRDGFELSDWMGGAAAYSPVQIHGSNSIGGTYAINLFAIVTDGTREIEAIELGQTGGIAPMVFAVTAGNLSSTPLVEGVAAMRRVDVDRMAGNMGAVKLASNTDAGYTLAARPQKGSKILSYGVSSAGSLGEALKSGRTQVEADSTVYAVEQRFSLAPGKSAVAGLVCSWYAQNHFDLTGRRFGHKYEEWWKDSGAVVEEIAKEHDSLLKDTKRHYDITATSTLPKWYREMIQSNFYLMPASTWYTKDGIAFTYETPNGCPLFGTMDVRYYGSFTKLAAFPELDAAVLHEFAGVQYADGFVPHDLGGSSGIVDTCYYPRGDEKSVEPNKDRSAYAGYWTNLPIKFCLEVARHYQWTGDKEFLKGIWPNVKRAVKWIDAQDEDDDGLPETQYGYDGWRMIDKCGYDANQWLSMLVAVSRLANELGEKDYASQLMETHKKALAQIEKLIWTGSYYKQSAGVNGSQDLDWVSLLQLAGTWYADILDFDDGLPNNHVLVAMKTMDRVLGGHAKYGLTDALKPDGSSINWWICDGQAVGWQYFYASHAMYRGLDDIALRVADETWTQFTVDKARIPWCQEEFIGDPPKGDCNYWLLRDMRMGSTMVMSYAAAGLRIDVPQSIASISPAEWIWKDNKFVLPVLMPKWLGQIKYTRSAESETYQITNLDKPFALKSLKLRTNATSYVTVSLNGVQSEVSVKDGMVDTGSVELGKKPVVVKISR